MAKKKYVAVHEVHFTEEPGVAANKEKGTPAKPPKVRIVKPKSSFMLDEDTAGPLLKQGAIRVAPKPEPEEEIVDAPNEGKAPAKKAPAKKAPAKKAEAKKDDTPSESSEGDSGENLV